MNKLKINQNSLLYQKVEAISENKKTTLRSLAKKLAYTESYLIDSLNREIWPAIAYEKFIKELVAALGVDVKDLLIAKEFTNEQNERENINKSEVFSGIEEKVRTLLRKKSISFVELAKKIGYSNAGLHRSFSNNNITITTLESIAKELDVDISYFFENTVIEHLIDEILLHDKTLDLKVFMFGFSRDISKGLSLKDAVYKNLDPEGYKLSLIL